MKKLYIMPHCQSIDLGMADATLQAISGGSEGGNGDEGEVREEASFNQDPRGSLWDEKW